MNRGGLTLSAAAAFIGGGDPPAAAAFNVLRPRGVDPPHAAAAMGGGGPPRRRWGTWRTSLLSMDIFTGEQTTSREHLLDVGSWGLFIDL